MSGFKENKQLNESIKSQLMMMMMMIKNGFISVSKYECWC